MEDREKKRLQTLHGYRLLDTPPEPEFDDVVRRAAERFGTPIALMSLVDADRQWFNEQLAEKLLPGSRVQNSLCWHRQTDTVRLYKNLCKRHMRVSKDRKQNMF